jgi:Na+/proline symporter
MVYEIVPGFLLSALAIVVVSLLDRAPPAAVTGVFDTVRARLAQPAARAR